ncbi:MAG: isopenicillin N synthase family oxygenase [Alphaproteobacteria bacterium]|nr:isopenicillin N synthase family oxygenase [Alphaproteobacteria bacterium]
MPSLALTTVDFDRVPVIDLAPFGQGAAARAQVVQAVARACERVGFLVITGHGVPAGAIADLDAQSRRFFDLPMETKLHAQPPSGTFGRGYTPYGRKALSYTRGRESPPDLRETYTAVRVDGWSDEFKARIGRPELFHENVWPAGMPEFKAAWVAGYRALDRLSLRLGEVFAAVLGLPQDWFADKFGEDMNKLMVANYPAQDGPPASGQLRAGAHTDYGSWTLIHQDGAAGSLQACNSAGDWIDVPAIANTFVVNLGDLMARWTNQRWVSTLHRVANPPAELAGRARRQSIIFFANPNFDARIECIPTCAGPGRPVAQPPITAGEHLHAQLAKALAMKSGG